MHRSFLTVAIAALSLTMLASGAFAAGPPERTYEITIDNLTDGQWLTPPLAATHRRSVDVFEVGTVASFELKELAENGNLAPMLDALQASRHVADTVVAPSPTGPPPLAPGGSVTFEVTAQPGAQVLSWASMLICTNDGFTGVDSLSLPKAIGETVTSTRGAYDAGTEVNTESWEDLVPPCAQLTGFGDQGGTGMSDPALAEDGVIHPHAGVTGTGDLVPEVHGWTDPAAAVTITRVG